MSTPRPDRVTRRYIEAAAHELHTPLTAILGYQELLGDGIYGDLPPGALDAVARIGRAGNQLMQLIDGLLDTVLHDSYSLEPAMSDVDLGAEIEAALREARFAAEERNGGIDGGVTVALPAIRGDAERIRRVLALAFLAAIRAEARARLTVAVEPIDDGARVRIARTALSPAALEPDPDRAPGADRLSLRLAVARAVLRALGGELRLIPIDGGGSTLELELHGLPPGDPSPSD